jgi:gamma-glutamylcyclotransferase (GGCT)/AIG2-like uncharacterized protein YtfP
MSEYLFLYGTLKPNEAAVDVAKVVKSLRRVGTATVPGRLYDFGDYPGAITDCNSAKKIHGDVFELPVEAHASLHALDQYEEFDVNNPEQSLFLRKKVSAKLFDGRELNCWMYVYNKEPGKARQITSGNYSQSKVA